MAGMDKAAEQGRVRIGMAAEISIRSCHENDREWLFDKGFEPSAWQVIVCKGEDVGIFRIETPAGHNLDIEHSDRLSLSM